MAVIRKIDCVQIPVPDLEAGLRFYRDGLGQPLVWRTATAAGLGLPESDGEVVVQVERPEMEANLVVAAVGEAVAAVVAAGGSVRVPPFPIPIGRCAVVADPWGNRLVLLDTSAGRLRTDADGRVAGVQAEAPPPIARAPEARIGAIVLRDSLAGITPERLTGFFGGWRRPVSPGEHLQILRGSAAVVLAVEVATERVVGFATAISDGVLCAHIPLLEVLPGFRGRGIGRALVQRLLRRLDDLYAVDVVCDPEVVPFYEKCGLRTTAGAAVRRY